MATAKTTKKTASKAKGADFEKMLTELEGIVEKLGSGELNLDKSIDEFEEGVKLYKDCKQYLDKAEKKISKLTDSLKEEIIE